MGGRILPASLKMLIDYRRPRRCFFALNDEARSARRVLHRNLPPVNLNASKEVFEHELPIQDLPVLTCCGE